MSDQSTENKRPDVPEATQKEQMCCEGGMTAAEHRAKSPNGKCCTDT